MYIKGLLDKI
jgi:phosphoacetylglucosamine mutase